MRALSIECNLPFTLKKLPRAKEVEKRKIIDRISKTIL